MPEIKFCGMTRPADARMAAELGAAYVGVVFAGGPRRQDDASAAAILAALPAGVTGAGVFGADPAPELARRASALGLGVVQLHGDPSPRDVRALRAGWKGVIWAALRVRGTELPAMAGELFAVADAVVLDAKVEGALGGTGTTLPWRGLAAALAPVRARGARLVLAGGLRPENVADAIRALAPDVVDVSSGIESTVGIKDPGRMRAFRDAVRSVEEAR
ncbi:MAG: phosphoribosylanthranilate isomerase [Gemmatimonadota bacterium]|nr:phosphoribosylanthranilate isomerase [Gemmatimonadota bacterium]